MKRLTQLKDWPVAAQLWRNTNYCSCQDSCFVSVQKSKKKHRWLESFTSYSAVTTLFTLLQLEIFHKCQQLSNIFEWWNSHECHGKSMNPTAQLWIPRHNHQFYGKTKKVTAKPTKSWHNRQSHSTTEKRSCGGSKSPWRKSKVHSRSSMSETWINWGVKTFW